MSHLSRSRLFDRIDDHPRLVILRAEGGAGKTSTVSEWVNDRGHDKVVIWMSHPEGHLSVFRFWKQLALAALMALPDPQSARLSEQLERSFTPEQISALFTAAVLQVPQETVLVIDDMHHASSDWQQLLIDLLRRIPSLRLIIMTRSATALETDLTLANFSGEVLDSRELAFTRQEVVELCKAQGDPISDAEVALVSRYSHGHPLATRIAPTVLKSHRHEHDAPGLGEVTDEIHRATAELMPAFGAPETERFALKIAVCPVMTKNLANKIKGHQMGGNWFTVSPRMDWVDLSTGVVKRCSHSTPSFMPRCLKKPPES